MTPMFILFCPWVKTLLSAVLRSAANPSCRRQERNLENGKGKKRELPRGRIELPSKDYPSHAWSFRWPIWDLCTNRYTIEAWWTKNQNLQIYCKIIGSLCACSWTFHCTNLSSCAFASLEMIMNHLNIEYKTVQRHAFIALSILITCPSSISKCARAPYIS